MVIVLERQKEALTCEKVQSTMAVEVEEGKEAHNPALHWIVISNASLPVELTTIVALMIAEV